MTKLESLLSRATNRAKVDSAFAAALETRLGDLLGSSRAAEPGELVIRDDAEGIYAVHLQGQHPEPEAPDFRALLLEAEDFVREDQRDLRQRIADALHQNRGR